MPPGSAVGARGADVGLEPIHEDDWLAGWLAVDSDSWDGWDAMGGRMQTVMTQGGFAYLMGRWAACPVLLMTSNSGCNW